MASGPEVKVGDIIARGEIEAPLQLKRNTDLAIKSIDKLLSLTRKSAANLSIAKSVIKITDETNKLSKAQVGLSEVQKKVAINAKTVWLSENEVAASIARAGEASKRTGTALNELDKQQHKVANSATAMSGAQKTYTAAAKNAQAQTSSLGGEYKKLTAQLADNIKKYKDMAASGKATISSLEDQRKAVVNLEAKIRSIDNAVGQFQRNVGNYPKVIGTATQSLMQFMHAFGLVTGIYLFAHALKDAIKASVAFEMANSRLLALMEGNQKQAAQLRKQQLELASSTLYSADQYAELQIELAKLGFTFREIQKMTESTAKASIAMGSDLAAQAELTGSIIHQYSLDANQTEKVNDQLSKATVKSALSFDKLATAMPYVGSAAAALGFDLSETLALMGQLANAGLGASTIGTSLRKIFLLLADSSSELAKKFREPVRDLPTLLKGLKELKLNNTDLAEALELTDVRSVVAFQSLIDGAAKVEKLNNQIEDSVGFTNALAKTVKDNLGGDLKLLTSALTQLGIVLGGVLNDALRGTVQGFTYFIRLLKELPRFISQNKELIIALAVSLVTLKIAAVGANASLIAVRWNLLRKVVALKTAIATTRAFTATLMANPLFVFATAITAIVAAFNIYDRTLGKTAKVTEAFTATNNLLNESIKNTEKDLAALTVSEAEYMRLKDHQIAVNEALIEVKAQELNVTKQLALANLKMAEFEAKQLDNSQKREASRGSIENQIKKTKEFEAANLANNEAYKEQKAETDLLLEQLDEQIAGNARLKELYKGLAQLKVDIAKKDALQNNEDKLKAESKIIEDSIKLDNQRLKFSIEASKKIADNENNSMVARQNALEEIAAFEKQIAKNNYALAVRDYRLSVALIKNEVNAKIITEQEGAEKLKALNELTNNQRKIAAEDLQHELKDIEQSGVEGRSQIAYKAQLAALEKAKNLDIAAAEERAAMRKADLDFEITLIQQQVIAGKKSKEKGDKEIEKLERDHRAILIDEAIKYQRALIDIEEKSNQEAKAIIDKSNLSEVEKNAAKKALDKDWADRKKELLSEIYNLELAYSDASYANTESLYEKEIEFLENLYDVIGSYGNAIGNLFQSISDNRVAAINSELNANKRFYEKQLILAGDNEAAKDKLRLEAAQREEALERKRVAAQKKAAAYDKALALVQSVIHTALAVTKALPNIPLAIAVGALGAIETAAIAAKPLPQYADGTPPAGHPGGPAIVGERGPELVSTPTKTFLTPGRATMMNLPKGTHVTPNEETMRSLAAGSMSRIDSVTPEYLMQQRLSEMTKTIEEGNASIVNAIVENTPDYASQGSLLLKIQKKRDGSKKITHSRAMGY